MIRYLLLLFIISYGISPTFAQEEAKQIESDVFLTTRLINAHTTETVRARHLDIRITHRFGDIGGDLGGIQSLYGLDNVTDVRIALEYGITDQLTLGFGRSKGVDGAGPTKLIDGFAKYQILRQAKGGSPLSLTVFGNAVVSHMDAGTVPTSETAFTKFAHRLSYDFQVIIARKFSPRLSLQLMPNFLHRNLVRFEDENNNFSMGIGGRIGISKNIAVIFDYYYLLSNYRSDETLNGGQKFYMPLGIGFEFRTGGHVFHLNFSNTPGIIENQYIPYTLKNWLDGEFRLGFNISRPIRL